MKIKIELNIVGVKPGLFTDPNTGRQVQFYNAYDDKGRKYGIKEDIYNEIKSGKVPTDLSLTCDDKGNYKLVGVDKDIIAV